MTSVCVGEHRSLGALSVVCRDRAQGFDMCSGGGNRWHTLTLALSGQKKSERQVRLQSALVCHLSPQVWVRSLEGRQCGNIPWIFFTSEKGNYSSVSQQRQRDGSCNRKTVSTRWKRGTFASKSSVLCCHFSLPSFRICITRIWRGWEVVDSQLFTHYQ